jgi:flavin reductase
MQASCRSDGKRAAPYAPPLAAATEREQRRAFRREIRGIHGHGRSDPVKSRLERSIFSQSAPSLDAGGPHRDVKAAPAKFPRDAGPMDDAVFPSVSGALYREAMSRVAEQVHVIATDGAAGLAGATATAVASVSDAPPSLLVCLNRASGTLERIRGNGLFSVNVLAASQEEIGRIFAGAMPLEGAARFRAEDGWTTEPGAAPVLSGALASFACRVTELTAVGSHVVVFGLVERIAVGSDEPPLLYHRRAWRAL